MQKMPKRPIKDYFLEMKLIDGLAIAALTISLALLTNSLSPYLSLPNSNIIPVPFTSQAPLGIWTEPWQNACEETSILMVNEYYRGPDAGKTINPTDAAKNIQEIFRLKEVKLGASYDESAATMESLISNLSGSFTAYVVEHPSLNRIKYQLAQNRPIIVPVYAPDLHFSHYSGPSDYHVIVLTGYSDITQSFYINDPGASKGEQLTVPYQTLMSAIHDLNIPEYTAGVPRVLFTAPRQ